MEDTWSVLISGWPIAFGVISLIIVLAKMHGELETLKEKVKVLFELWNSKDK
jgi:ABC-type lipoprotein release transport system permease subunit|tara:strand:+ start:11289 stop:11444 length:156 start_codon:yes stop_codon:yes gene_type:complete